MAPIPGNIIGRFVTDALSRSITDMVSTMGQGLADYATSRTSRQLVAFVEEISTGPSASEAEATHQRLAQQMAQSTRRSWGQAKRRLRPAIYNPVRSSRFSGGMDKALGDADLATATARGVSFGNVAVLDRDAAQWARLNFGAGPRGQGAHERFEVRFSNLPAAEFSFEESARPGYGLPKGVFMDPSGRRQSRLARRSGPGGSNFAALSGDVSGGRSGAFYPFAGAKQEFPTRGNVGYNYLDAGIARFFERLPIEYGRLFRKVLPSSQRVGRPPIIAETKRASRRG